MGDTRSLDFRSHELATANIRLVKGPLTMDRGAIPLVAQYP